MTTRLEEQTLVALRDIQRRAREAQDPLDCVEATLAIEELAAHAIRVIRESRREPSPLALAHRMTPDWMARIRDFDALEIHPCCVVGFSDGKEIVETTEAAKADFWTVYGHCRSVGIEAFEDFPTKEEAIRFRGRLEAAYPHLAS